MDPVSAPIRLRTVGPPMLVIFIRSSRISCALSQPLRFMTDRPSRSRYDPVALLKTIVVCMASLCKE
jgi:hypothetical protein